MDILYITLLLSALFVLIAGWFVFGLIMLKILSSMSSLVRVKNIQVSFILTFILFLVLSSTTVLLGDWIYLSLPRLSRFLNF